MTQQFDKLHEIAKAYGFERDAKHFPAPARVVNGPAEHQLLDFLLCGEAFDAWRLWKEKGPFKLNFDEIDAEACELSDLIDRSLIKGFRTREIFPISGKDLASRNMCLNIMQAAGLLGSSEKLSKLIGNMLITQFGPKDAPAMKWTPEDLPILRDGQLDRPELLLAADLQSHIDTLGVYDEILCWASPEMLEQHAGLLRPYQLKQFARLSPRVQDPDDPSRTMLDFSLRCDLSELHDLLISKFGAKPTADGDLDFTDAGDFVIEYIECLMAVEGREPSEADDALLKAYGSRLYDFGLGGAPDRLLCAASREFLKGFPEGAFSPERVSLLQVQLQKLQFDLVAWKLDPDRKAISALAADEYQGKVRCALEFVWSLGRDSEVFSHMKAQLTPNLLRRTIEDPQFIRYSIRLDQLNFMRSLSMATSGWEIRLREEELSHLVADRYRFAPNTKLNVEFTSPEPSFEHKVKVMGDALSLSTFPVTLNGVEMSEGMLIDLARLCDPTHWKIREFSAQYVAYARSKGPGGIVEQAKTAEDWLGMVGIFTYRGLESVMHKMPRSAKAKAVGLVFQL